MPEVGQDTTTEETAEEIRAGLERLGFRLREETDESLLSIDVTKEARAFMEMLHLAETQLQEDRNKLDRVESIRIDADGVIDVQFDPQLIDNKQKDWREKLGRTFSGWLRNRPQR